MLLLIIVLILVFGGGGLYFHGNENWGPRYGNSSFGLGTILIIVLVCYMLHLF